MKKPSASERAISAEALARVSAVFKEQLGVELLPREGLVVTTAELQRVLMAAHFDLGKCPRPRSRKATP